MNLEIDCHVVRRDAAYGRLLCVVACVTLCALPSFAANQEITSDTSLAADATADALVVSPGATFDLNGHSLTVGDIRPGAGGMIAGRYRLYEYVLATGDQYIMTDYIPAATDRVQAKVRYTNDNRTYQFLFCTRINGKQSFTCLREDNNTTMRLDHGDAPTYVASAINKDKDYIVTMNGGAGAFSILTTDGTGKGGTLNRTANFIQPPRPFVLLSGGTYNADGSFTETANYRSKCRLYWFKVFDADSCLKCCMVPAEDTTTGTVGLYDIVRERFQAPTGTLTAEGTCSGIGGRVVNTSATEATLTVDVADGVTATNDAVEIAGNIKLVKSGGGSFVPSRFHQPYLGGTEVGGGTLKCGTDGDSHPFGTDDENLVRNGDFEATDLTTDYVFANDVAWTNCQHWTCGDKGITGLTKSTTSTWVPKGTDIGTYAMVMRTHANGADAYAEQTVYVANPGKYRLRFTYMACNTDATRRGGTFKVRLYRGSVTNEICSLSTTDVSKRFYSGTVDVAEPGAWTLQFRVVAGSKVLATIFDDVVLSKVHEERNLLVNGAFDESSISGTYSYANGTAFPSPGWTCDGENVGLTTANNTWVQSGVDVGKYAAYFRTQAATKKDAWLAQTVNVTTPGIYRLGFAYSVCSNADRRGEPVEVRLIHDGATNLVGTVTAPANYGKLYFSTLVNMAEAGAWTLQFWQKGSHLSGSAVRSTNIDDVSLELAPGVTVEADGTIDMNGMTRYNKTPFVMAGGTLVNTGVRAPHTGKPALGRMLLTADSSFSLAHAYGFYAKVNGAYEETFLDLGGHTLDVKLLNGDHMYIANCTMTNGTLRVSSVSDPGVYLAFIDGDSRAVDVDLEISNKLLSYSHVRAFRDLTLGADVTWDRGSTGVIEVGRRFKCLTAAFGNVKLLDGATFDISENSDVFNMTSTLSVNHRVMFDDGATVTVDTGARALAPGQKLIAWPERPVADIDWSFRHVCEGQTLEERGLALSVRPDGLYLKSANDPAVARMSLEGDEPTWRFFAENGTEVPDWSGGVTADMEVRFSSSEEYAAIAARASGIAPKEYLLDGGFSLPQDGEGVVDMSAGFAFSISSGITIDVKGRTLKLPDAMVGGTKPFTVTSSVAGGSLVVENAATIDNTSMALSGQLRLVKRGTGEFRAGKAGQTYSGGTEILEGMVRGAAASAPFGAAGSEVVVSTNGTQIGVMEMNGRADIYAAYTFVMNGGRVQNTASDIGSDRPQLKTMRLTADSHITATHNMGLTAATEEEVSLDLGGHALHVNVGNSKYFFLRMKEIKNGTIDVLSGGWTRFGIEGTFHEGDSHIVATNVDVIIRSALAVYAPVDVRGYEAQYYSNYDLGAYRFNVFGRFKPSAHNCFHACEMQDGSVLDLSARTNACPVASAFGTAIADGGPSLKFASGANVTVNLAGRTDLRALRKSGDPRIVAWTAGTAPDASVKFRLDDSTRKRYALRRDESGLSLIAGGLMVIVK